MATIRDARELLESLVGRTIRTVSGRPNTVLRVEDETVIVGTVPSPEGQPVPVEWVQAALDRLAAEGEVEVSVESVGYRSAFVGAALLAVSGTRATGDSPPRIVLDTAIQRVYRAEAAGQLHAWWASDSEERFWLEITDRPDIGVDLHCPQRDAAGNRSPGYSLIWWVEPADIVFHYDLNERAIMSWSRAVGRVVEAPVVWLSHRAATRRRLGVARPQPGWWLDLEGPYALGTPLTLFALRERGDEIRAMRDALEAEHGRPLYFPFFFYGGTELRPMQPYLNKLPAALVRALPELAGAAAIPTGAAARLPPTAPDVLGTEYRPATASALPDAREPFTVDPAVVERGLRGHAETQNQLAQLLREAGIEPRSPRPDEPNFDLAWERDGIVYVAEVKSLGPTNEERQLRLGLGQVLRYRVLLKDQRQTEVRAVLVTEREPRDPSWRALCDSLAVTLTTGSGWTEFR
jgi:hypothetical protein